MYSTQLDDKALQFGTSGLLYRGNKLTYDKTTGTLWLQFTGEPVVGPLADSGIKLDILPVVQTDWAEWYASHPDTTVLDIDESIYPPDRYPPESDPRSAYFDYREDSGTMFPVWRRSKVIPAKSQVLGLNVEGSPKAYPLFSLVKEQIINDSVGGMNVVIITIWEARAARAYQRSNNVRGGLVCLNSAARFDKWNHAAVR